MNTAVSVPAATGAGAKARVMLAYRWAQALEDAGLSLVDQVAWCSARGAGTAWGSWASPAAPNLRGDWESLLVACSGRLGEDGAAVLWGGLARHGGRLGVAVLHGLAPGPGAA